MPVAESHNRAFEKEGSGAACEAEGPSGSRPRRALLWIILCGTAILFAAAVLRHVAFRSGAMDLGFFDQGVYLISIGQKPISSYQYFGFNILGDHVALILYPLALLYMIHPTPLWLLLVQSLFLSLGVLPVYKLARHEGLSHHQALAMALVYLFYPYVLTTNLFDFHPDSLAVPALIAAVYFARARRRVGFAAAILFIFCCKELYGLFVAGMGVWLVLLGRRRLYGVAALAAGLGWYFLCVKVLIPAFGSPRIAGANYFPQFGSTMSEILKNLLLKPGLTLSIIFSLQTAKYLAIVFVPIIWGLHYRHLGPLLAALPVLALNIFSARLLLFSRAHAA